MSNEKQPDQSKNGKQVEKSVKKQIKHDPQAESARTKFGKGTTE